MTELNFVEIMKDLRQVAKSDGEVTEEEHEFLDALAKDVETFEKSVKIATQDNFISDDEFHELVILRDIILMKAEDFPSKSDDVRAMIKKLFDEINTHQLPGMTSDEVIGSKEEPIDTEKN